MSPQPMDQRGEEPRGDEQLSPCPNFHLFSSAALFSSFWSISAIRMFTNTEDADKRGVKLRIDKCKVKVKVGLACEGQRADEGKGTCVR